MKLKNMASPKPIPLNKTKRVFKNEADKALQKKLEGKNTFFQMKLRANEAAGNKTFDYNGEPIAAATANLPVERATGIRPLRNKPSMGVIPPIVPPGSVPNPVPNPFPSPDKPIDKNRNSRKQKQIGVRGTKQVMRNGRKVLNISPTGTKRKRGKGF